MSTEPLTDQSDGDFREAMLQATMARRGCDRAEAEVILKRIASRLDGYTHAEVAEMHPLPSPAASDEEQRR